MGTLGYVNTTIKKRARQAPMLNIANPNVMYKPSFFFQSSRRIRKIKNGKIKITKSDEKWRAQVVIQVIRELLVPQEAG
jgi:formaldehyde-activating enzyme involved in methanogenesis